MVGMTGAFAVSGIAQVYLERKLGMPFLEVQKEIMVHFYGALLAASLLTIGIILFIYNFLRYGRPSEEMVGQDIQQDAAELGANT